MLVAPRIKLSSPGTWATPIPISQTQSQSQSQSQLLDNILDFTCPIILKSFGYKVTTFGNIFKPITMQNIDAFWILQK